MYTKSNHREDHTLRIPENYSGNAFHGDASVPSPPIAPIPESPTLPEEESTDIKAHTVPAILPAEQENGEIPTMKRSAPFSSLLPPRLAGGRGGILGEIGIEELLIIGVLILLSQSETDDDILLLLVLLLFYK